LVIEKPVIESESVGAIDRDTALAQGRLLLIAEDNEVNQKVITHQLKALGYVADVASDGVEALNAWQSGNYCLLLTDIHMPNMGGFELAQRIRQGKNAFSERPIIAVTANALPNARESCLMAGMNDCLSKPHNLSHLKSVLETWLPAPAMGSPSVDVSSDPASETSAKDSAAKYFDVGELKKLLGDDPAIIVKFVTDYRQALGKDQMLVKEAFTTGTPSATANLAHRMKSSARVMGAIQLANCCELIEKQGKSGSGPLEPKLFDEFNAITIRVLKAVDAYLLKPD
jgi:two-component system, sensor histidine kinase and response regulator